MKAKSKAKAGPKPSIRVTVTRLDGVRLPRGAAQRIAAAIRAALMRHPCPRAAIHVAVTTDAHIARLHAQHLAHPGPTDVLTFDFNDAVPEGLESTEGIEGEIVISLETAVREAAARGLPTAHELTLYALHGTLHLLGFDDTTAAAAARMHRLEDEILCELGIGPVYHAPTGRKSGGSTARKKPVRGKNHGRGSSSRPEARTP